MRHPLAVAPPASPPRRRRARAATRAVPVAALVAALALSAPAMAHDALLASDPPDGAVLDAAPAQVVLTFAAPQAGIGSEVLVAGADGRVWSDGAPQVVDVTVTQPLLPDMPAGDYAVTWRSVAGDGHPVSGTFTFTVTAVATEPAGAPSGEPASEPTQEPTATATVTAVPAEPPADAATEPPVDTAAGRGDAASSGPGPWPFAAAGVAAAGAAALVAHRRRRVSP